MRTAHEPEKNFLALVFALVMAAFAIPVAAQSTDQSQPSADTDKTPVGSWQTTVLPVPEGPQFTPFPGLITFNSDGTLIESDGANASGTFPPPNPFCNCTIQAIDNGHGVWKKIADNQYEIKIIQIGVNLSDSTVMLTNTLRFAVEIDGNNDRFHGPGTFRLTDANGKPISGFAGPEQIKAMRI